MVESQKMGVCLTEYTFHEVRLKFRIILLANSVDRYGNASQMPPTLQRKYQTFAENFVSTFAPQILTVYLQQTRLYVAQEAWLSKRALYFIGQFFTEW